MNLIINATMKNVVSLEMNYVAPRPIVDPIYKQNYNDSIIYKNDISY